MHRRRLASSLLVIPLALALAACGSSATTQPTGSPTPAVTPTPTPTPAPPTTAPTPPTATPAPGETPTFALPSLTADKQLEDLLPDELGGSPLTKTSMSGQDLVDFGGLDPETQALLDRLGASIEDVSIAYAADSTGTVEVNTAAVRVKGANSDTLRNEIVASAIADGKEVTDGTIAGKAVKVATDPTGSNATEYIWVRGDIAFVVTGDDQALVAEAVGKMP